MEHLNPLNDLPFGVPKDYFESFEDTLMARIAEEDLKAMVPNSGFVIPPQYMATLENIVMSKLDAGSKTKVISIVRRKTVYGIVAVAACLLLIVTIFNNPKATNQTLADVETETLESFINSDAIAYSNYELINFYADSELEFNTTTNSEEISSEDLEEYLIDYLDSDDLLNQYEE